MRLKTQSPEVFRLLSSVHPAKLFPVLEMYKDQTAFIKYSFLSLIVGILELFGVALTYPFIIKLLDKESGSTSLLLGIAIIVLFLAKNIFMIFYTFSYTEFNK